jgi:chromosome partitioning protein
MRRIVIAAAKGGTGKTTTAVTLAHGLALAGERVLLVDCDPSRDASRHFGLPPSAGLAGWLAGRDAHAVVVRPGLRVLDSGGDALADLEPALAHPGAERRLRAALDAVADADWVIVDCPPGPGALARLALAACDEVLMPLAADYLSLASAATALARFARAGERGGPGLRLVGILPTFCDPDAATAAQVEAVLAELHPGRVLQTRIEVADALRDAPARRGTIFDCAPLSRAAFDYARLIEEVRAAVHPHA